MKWKNNTIKLIFVILFLLITAIGYIKERSYTPPNKITISLQLANHYKPPLDDTTPATEYGALLELGELDHLGRASFAHIQLSDKNEPAHFGQKRNPKINYNPKGWLNFKLNGNWANDRCHLIGYQFSGLNDEPKNLVTGTAYLNRGTEGRGMDQTNPDSMLFYEQALDNWLALHPNYKLDYYVKPLYDGDNLTPSAIYMQWVGLDGKDEPILIQIGGHSKQINNETSVVILKNQSPSYDVDYKTGHITLKE